MLPILLSVEYKLAGVPNLINGVPDLVDGKIKIKKEKMSKLFKSILLTPTLLI